MGGKCAHIIWLCYLLSLVLGGCTMPAVRQAEAVVAQADSLWQDRSPKEIRINNNGDNKKNAHLERFFLLLAAFEGVLADIHERREDRLEQVLAVDERFRTHVPQ